MVLEDAIQRPATDLETDQAWLDWTRLRPRETFVAVPRTAGSIHAWVKTAAGLDGSGAKSIDAPFSTNERHELIELRRKFKQVHA